MLARRFAVGLLALATLAVARSALAQNASGQEKDKTLIDRIDNFGKTIFGGILPAEKNENKPQPSTPKPSAAAGEVDLPPNGRRAGSVLDGAEAGRRRPVLDTPVDDANMTPENTPQAALRKADGTPKPIRQPLAGSSLLDERGVPEDAGRHPPLALSRDAASTQTAAPNGSAETAIVKQPGLPPIHRRLSASRQSVFDSDASETPVTEPEVKTDRKPQLPSISTDRAAVPPPPPPTTSRIAEMVRPAPTRPIVAQRIKPSTTIRDTISAEPALGPAMPSPAMPEMAPAEKLPLLAEPHAASSRSDSDGGLLMSRKGPVLSVETLGPRRIAVGRESTYEVSIVNSGEVAGEDLVVFVSMPEWAEVASAQASTGAVAASASSPAGTLQWKLGHLDAKGRERLTLKVVPRQSRPFDLAVRWEYKPVASQAMIEVQEPRLQLQLEGPREVLYGKKETYRLRLNNIGNGAAENVAIMLMPLGGSENMPATHKLGVLRAGEEKALDVELTARQAGGLTIQVDARADGGVHAELAEKVLVRRAGLTIDVQGPKVQFVQAPATYAIRIRNPGTAPARNVKLTIVLPAGARYLSGVDGAHLDVATNRVDWTVENIGPEVEQSFAVRCTLGSAGMSRLQVNATAADDLTTSAAAVTRVEAVANLVMEVTDPEGPVAVNAEVMYEVHVRNRGTKEAPNVEVFAYFSRGIEPTGAEGAPNRLTPGQVSFQPIPSLAPGAEAVFRIRARADVAGNHVFRAEAHCKPLSSRLIRETTNLYYTDASAVSPSTGQPGLEAVPANAMRTVTRPVPDKQFVAPPRQ